MGITKKHALILLAAGCLLSASSSLYAAETLSNGTAAANFLNIDVGARPAGMGGAFCAVADETSGMYSNPAGLGYSTSPELQTTYSMWLAETYYGYMGYSHPTNSGTFGLGLQYLSSPAIPKLVDGVAAGDFNFSDSAASLLYAKRLGDNASFGLNIKNVQSKIDTNTVSTVTGDFGVLFRTLEEGFSFGLSGSNLFGKLNEEKLPTTYRAGMAFKLSVPEQSSDFLLTLEAGKTQSSPDYYAAGIEHWGAGTLGLRAGYKYLVDEKHQLNMDPLAPWHAGISIRIKKFEMDYAYQPFAALGVTHRISLTWRANGWFAKWRVVPAQLKVDPNIFSPNNDGAKDSVFFVPQASELREVRSWEMVIEDISHNPVMKFTGKDVMPKILSWEGQTEKGDFVSEGKYYARFTAEGDGRKRAVSANGEIIADLTAPAVSLQVSTDTFSLNKADLGNAVTFYVSVIDTYGIDQWQLNILNDRGRSIKVYKSTVSIPVGIVWDGKDEFYGKEVPGGVYEVRASAWDIAGNKTRVTQKITLVAPKEAPKDINIRQESRGLVVNLSSQVLFGAGKAVLKPQAYKALDEVITLLQTYSENEVLVEGHSDSSGSKKKNQELSGARAWAVYSYLVKKGVAAARLKPKGYGSGKPVASNRTSAGRTKNRRVEIIILKKDKPK